MGNVTQKYVQHIFQNTLQHAITTCPEYMYRITHSKHFTNRKYITHSELTQHCPNMIPYMYMLLHLKLLYCLYWLSCCYLLLSCFVKITEGQNKSKFVLYLAVLLINCYNLYTMEDRKKLFLS